MGTNNKATIEINGKRYDAVSGAFLGDVPGYTKPAAPRRSVDGFHAALKPAGKPLVERSPAQHVAPHKPSPSETLMRTAVKKPEIKSAETIKAQTRTDILARIPQQTVAPKVSYSSVDPHRLKKATQMVQNPAVSHYGPASAVTPAPVSYAPKADVPLTKTLDSFRSPSSPTTVRQVADLPVKQMHQPEKRPDIFEQAMARATSHEQAFEAKSGSSKGRLALLATVCMALLLLVGAVAYFNVPQISLRLASARAGFQAKLPGYSPVGYSFGNLSYGPGNVTISYKEDDNHKFDITQRASQWDSQELLANFVANANKAYQTYEQAGRTIYFFGNNTATWVDNGVWYTVDGNNSLSKTQLLDLAGSI